MGLMGLTLVKTRVQEDEAALAVFDPEENIGQSVKESQCDLTGAQCSHKVLKSGYRWNRCRCRVRHLEFAGPEEIRPCGVELNQIREELASSDDGATIFNKKIPDLFLVGEEAAL